LASWYAAVIHRQSLLLRRTNAARSRVAKRMSLAVVITWRAIVNRRSAVAALAERVASRGALCVLAAWCDVAAERRTHRSLLHRHLDKRDTLLVVAVLAGWQYRARSCAVARARSASLCVAKVERRIRADCLLGWAALCALLRQSRSLAGQLAAPRRRLSLSLALGHWRRATQLALEARAAVRRSVTARKVAKDWFLGWYSNAFELEIKQAMEALYGACDDRLDEVVGAADGCALGQLRESEPTALPVESLPREQVITAAPVAAWAPPSQAHIPHTQWANLRIPRSLAFDVSRSFSSDSSAPPSEAGEVEHRPIATLTPMATPIVSSVPRSVDSLRTPLIFAFDPEDVDGEAAASARASARVAASNAKPFASTNPMYGNPLYAGQGARESVSPMGLVLPSPHPGYQPASAARRRPLASCQNSVDARLRSGGSKPAKRATPVRSDLMRSLLGAAAGAPPSPCPLQPHGSADKENTPLKTMR